MESPTRIASIHQLLDVAARRWPDATAIRDATGADSYAELARASRRLAQGLRAMGVRPGDRVVLHQRGGRDFAAVLYGVLRAGAVAVPINPATGPLHRRWMLSDAAPRLVVTAEPDAFADTDITIADPAAIARAGADRPAAASPDPPVGAGAVALLLYTSGSTAMPRAVVCPHERVLFVVEAIRGRLSYTGGDVVLSRIPVSFDYGLYQLFLSAQAGATLVLRPDLTEPATLAAARAVGATVLPIVPTLGEVLLRMGGRGGTGGVVRMLTSTGSALAGPLAQNLRRLFGGAVIVPMYGMTECKRITIAEPDEDRLAADTVGRPLDGTEVRVVDDAGRPVRPGTVGQILVRGPHVMDGYWQAPAATAERFSGLDGPDRMLHTGDLGHLDRRGRLYIAGRRDDVFKRRSVRMSTAEVVAAALAVPGVSAAAALPPGQDGQLTVYVVATVAPSVVLAGMAAWVDRARIPDRCVVLPDLPVTANGKVDQAALRQLDRS